MKFMTFHEYDVEDTEKVIEKFKQRLEESEKEPDKFPKILLGPFAMGEYDSPGLVKNVTIHEVDDPNQLLTLAIFFSPEISYRFVPLFESSIAIQLYMQMKK